MTPISKELQDQIEREAEALANKRVCLKVCLVNPEFKRRWNNVYQDYIDTATAYAHYKERCEDLERWKREAMELINPLLDYGHSKEANIPLGKSIPAVILERAKAFEQAKKALETVAMWVFPETGKFWDDEQTRPMSYAACFGSNGERDYMRNIAVQALHPQDEALASWKEEGKEGDHEG